jgi:hypothetical protein
VWAGPVERNRRRLRGLRRIVEAEKKVVEAMTFMLYRTLLGLVFVLSFGLSAAAAAEPPTASISGVVENGDTGVPVMAVTVHAYDANSQTAGTTVTDAAGSFSIGGLRDGWFTLHLSHVGYFEHTSLGIRVSNGSRVELMRQLRLFPLGSPQGNATEPYPLRTFSGPSSLFTQGITGTVVRSDNQTPVAGAVLAVYIPPYVEAQTAAVTDSEGRFAIMALFRGTYMLRATARFFVPTVIDGVSVDGGAITNLPNPIEIEAQIFVLDDTGFFRPCGTLVQPSRTADEYVVCGNRLNY